MKASGISLINQLMTLKSHSKDRFQYKLIKISQRHIVWGLEKDVCIGSLISDQEDEVILSASFKKAITETWQVSTITRTEVPKYVNVTSRTPFVKCPYNIQRFRSINIKHLEVNFKSHLELSTVLSMEQVTFSLLYFIKLSFTVLKS